MAKNIDKPINARMTSWDGYKGSRVTEYLNEATRNISEYYNGALYFFRTQDDYDAWKGLEGPEKENDTTYVCQKTAIEIKGLIYDIEATGSYTINDSSSAASLSNGGAVTLKTPSFKTKTTTISSPPETSYLDEDNYTITIEKLGEDGTYETAVQAGTRGASISIDLTRFCDHNATTVFRARVKSEESGKSTSNVTLPTVTMYSISASIDSTNWPTAFVGGSTYNACVLNVNTSGAAVYIRARLGTTNGYSLSAYGGFENITSATSSGKKTITLPAKMIPATSGVYKLHISVRTGVSYADSKEVTSFSWNIMCVTAADAGTATIAMASTRTTLASKMTNGKSVNLFNAGCYNKGGSDPLSMKLIVRMKGFKAGDDETYEYEESVQLIPGQSNAVGYTSSIDSEEKQWYFGYGYEYMPGKTCTLKSATGSSAGTVTNNVLYAPVNEPGMFQFRPSAYSNGDPNVRTQVANARDPEDIKEIETENIGFKTTDGYITDAEGRKCLLVPALGKMTFKDFSPLSDTGGGLTLDMMIKLSGVASFSDPAITIATTNPADNSWTGLKVLGDSIVLHTSTYMVDVVQNYTFIPEEIVHLCVVYDNSHPLTRVPTATIYMNGAKVREVQYTGAQDIQDSANLSFCPASSDLYIYGIRFYKRPLTDKEVLANFIADADDPEAEYNKNNAIYKSNGSVGIDECKTVGNVFVVTVSKNTGIPEYTKGENYKPSGSLEIYYKGNSTPYRWGNVKIKGQGSSSRLYSKWNLDFQNKDKTPLMWAPGQMAINVLTAKKNVASGTHGHKMGFTKIYDTLHKALLKNTNNVAVLQYPFYGFLYDSAKDTYEFIGLYTMGPSKSDDIWFGYTKNFIQVEGKNHDRTGAAFVNPIGGDGYLRKMYTYDLDVNEDGEIAEDGTETFDVFFDETPQAFLKNNPDLPDDGDFSYAITDGTSDDVSWEFTIDDSNGKVKDLWEAAYEFVHSCNVNLVVYTKAPTTTTHSFKENSFNEVVVYNTGASYADIHGFVYTYNRKNRAWEKTSTNVFDQISDVDPDGSKGFLADFTAQRVTNEARAGVLKRMRVELFKKRASQYWDVDALIYEYVYKIVNGVSDNFMKNFYPYCVYAVQPKMGVRQDDVDTIGPINNSGRNGKPYDCDFGSIYDTGSTKEKVFNGEPSALAQILASDGFESERETKARAMLSEMARLGGSSQSMMTNLLGFYEKYVWANAQKYFPASAYNEDTAWTYEPAKYQMTQGICIPPEDPIRQVCGPSYETEKAWFTKRMLFCMSKYRMGDFSSVGQIQEGKITFEPTVESFFTIKYAVSIYPMYYVGDLDARPRYYTEDGVRVNVQEEQPFTMETDGGTGRIHIPAANYIQYIKTSAIYTTNGVFEVTSGERLQEVDFTGLDGVNTIQLTNCPALSKVSLKNSVITTFNVGDNSKRVHSFDASGSRLAAFSLPTGCKAHVVSLPASINSISLRDIITMESMTIDGYSNLTRLFTSGCSGVPALLIMARMTNGDKTVGVYNTEEEYAGDEAAAVADMLKNFSTSRYKGLGPNGSSSASSGFITGKVTLSGVSDSDKQAIRTKFGNALTIL